MRSTAGFNLSQIRITPQLIEELIDSGFLEVGDTPLDLHGSRVIYLRYDHEPAPIGEFVVTLEHDNLPSHRPGSAILKLPVQVASQP